MNNDDIGKDLRTGQSLKRKHKGLESCLAALGDKINQLDDEKASKLMHTHQDNAEVVYEKQKDIKREWTNFCAKTNVCKVKLLDSCDLQRFLSDKIVSVNPRKHYFNKTCVLIILLIMALQILNDLFGSKLLIFELNLQFV